MNKQIKGEKRDREEERFRRHATVSESKVKKLLNYF